MVYGDNSMEYYAVVVTAFFQLCKVLAGPPRAIVELENNVRDPSNRKAATNIPLLLEYGTALPESPEISLQSFLSEAALRCRHFSYYNCAAGQKERPSLATRYDLGEWIDVASGE